LVAQVCEALEYAHTVAKVVHRDLKPSNLMINSKRELKVTDFGIARSIADTASRLSGKSGTSGTPAYMSPQQANGEKASHADDIYALGATLYELLTSKPPFYSGDILDQLKHKVPVRIGERRRELGIEGEEVPVHWEETIAACLAKDPVQRPQSAAEVAKRLLAGVKFEKGASLARLIEAGEESPKVKGCSAKNKLFAGTLFGIMGAATLLLAFLHGHSNNSVATQLRGLQKPIVLESKTSQGAASELNHWTNSLGMRFAPVQESKVMFCIWVTRVQDFEAFVKATGYNAEDGMLRLRPKLLKQNGENWRHPGFAQGPTHPVIGISWVDAKAFCEWLTKQEKKLRKIGQNQFYRLPTDAEWSTAVGLPEEFGRTPEEKSGKIPGYPWGTQWPPPPGAGNYWGQEIDRAKWPKGVHMIEGYNDGFEWTSPVGSFSANKFGLYDMGGNVWQWCEDWFNEDKKDRVLRGGCYGNPKPEALLSSARKNISPGSRQDGVGFRVVLAEDPR
jgi:hypothetical protein